MSYLQMTTGQYREVLNHLLGAESEEVVFLFTSLQDRGSSRSFDCKEIYKVPPSGFERQSAYHICLSDRTRQQIIKHASDTQTCLVEAHSHLNNLSPVEFSASDMIGFEEFVPHVRWRLGGRPYIALVYNKTSFDALVWENENNTMRSLQAIEVGKHRIFPTNLSLKRLRKESGSYEPR